MIGEIIDSRYRVLRKLGEGGMGAVYEAEHTGTGRRVAVKVISNIELAKRSDVALRFQREARAAGTVETQHIVQVFDTGTDAQTGMPYIVMELMAGEDLQQLVRRLGCLHPELALRLVGQACVGLLKAHEAGVTHRDIKPANLFLARRDDGELVVKLLDFGIAKVKASVGGMEEAALTSTSSVLGSPLFMSPEQTMGLKNTDHRTDIWSMGAVLHELLTGRAPHGDCETLGMLIMMICSRPTAPIQDLVPWTPAQIAAVAHGALVIDVEGRFQSMAAMLDPIRRLLPHGLNVRPDMLVPMTDQQRAYVAPRPAPPVPAVAPSMPGANALPDASLPGGVQAQVGAASTGPQGLSISGIHGGRSKGPSGAVIFAASAVLVALVGGGFGVYRLVGRGAASQPTAAPVVPLVEQAPAALSPASPPPSAAPEPVLAAERTFRVAVEPATAKVDVDDIAAQVKDGSVEVRGRLGSRHHVRVRSGGRETVSEVVITESGPLPSKIQLGIADAKLPSRPGVTLASSPPKDDAASKVGAGRAPITPTATPAAPPSKPADTGASREFE